MYRVHSRPRSFDLPHQSQKRPKTPRKGLPRTICPHEISSKSNRHRVPTKGRSEQRRGWPVPMRVWRSARAPFASCIYTFARDKMVLQRVELGKPSRVHDDHRSVLTLRFRSISEREAECLEMGRCVHARARRASSAVRNILITLLPIRDGSWSRYCDPGLSMTVEQQRRALVHGGSMSPLQQRYGVPSVVVMVSLVCLRAIAGCGCDG